MRKIFERIFNRKKETKPKDFEWEKFQEQAKEQFKKLDERGLHIPVFTL